MKKIKITYWVFTGLLAALMLLSSIPNILSVSEAVDLVSKHLGYPAYIIPFLGVAKFLAVIAIIVPGFPRLKEWAYAGLVFDLLGAIYSSFSTGDPASGWLPILLPLVVLGLSYFFYHKKQRAAVGR